MSDHTHTYEYVSPGRRECRCGARLAVEVQFHANGANLGAPTLRGSDIAWAIEQAAKIRNEEQ